MFWRYKLDQRSDDDVIDDKTPAEAFSLRKSQEICHGVHAKKKN